MGASCYTYHGPMRLKRTPYKFNFDLLGERIGMLCEAAKEFDMTLCYENVHYSYYSYPEYFANLAERIPNLGTCLDIKQAMQGGYSYKDFFKVAKDRIKTIHVCDFDDNGSLLLPGRGTFDFEEFFKIMKGEGVDAPMLLEVYSGSYKDFSDIADSFNYLCEINDKIN